MLGRFFFGLTLGTILGGAIAAVAVKLFGFVSFQDSPIAAYLFAVLTGAFVGLVAGKPIWSKDGPIEAGLKGVFGALLAAGAMFALRKWLTVPFDLDSLGGGKGNMGELAGTSLPIIAAGLAGVFEADNDPADDKAAPAQKRIAPSERVEDGVEDEEVEEAPKKSAKR